MSDLIVELEILDKLDDGYDKLLEEHRKKTKNWDKPYPPKPIVPPSNYSDFSIKVKKIYKGQLSSKFLKLRAEEKYSSCYWEPEIGEQYIFYLGKSIFENEIEIVQLFGACHRVINTASRNYKTEKKSLKFFKKKKNGRFGINQVELVPPSFKINKLFTVEGRFKKGKRHGIWVLREPVEIYQGDTLSNKVILKLRYDHGKLLEVESFKINYKDLELYHIWRTWFFYYKEKINP